MAYKHKSGTVEIIADPFAAASSAVVVVSFGCADAATQADQHAIVEGIFQQIRSKMNATPDQQAKFKISSFTCRVIGDQGVISVTCAPTATGAARCARAVLTLMKPTNYALYGRLLKGATRSDVEYERALHAVTSAAKNISVFVGGRCRFKDKAHFDLFAAACLKGYSSMPVSGKSGACRAVSVNCCEEGEIYIKGASLASAIAYVYLSSVPVTVRLSCSGIVVPASMAKTVEKLHPADKIKAKLAKVISKDNGLEMLKYHLASKCLAPSDDIAGATIASLVAGASALLAKSSK